MSAAASAGSKKNILVFGGTGYVGRRVVAQALKAGYEVTSISRSGQAPFDFPDAWRVQWLSCDVTNRRSVEELLTRVPVPVDGVVSAIGLLTLNRTAAIQLNGTCNTNVIAAMYNRQRLILKERWDEEQANKAAEKKSESKQQCTTTEKESSPPTKSTEKSDDNSSSSFDFKTSDALNSKEKAVVQKGKKGATTDDSKDLESTDGAPKKHEVVDENLPFYKYSPAPIPEENKLPLDLPHLTEHKSGIPRFVFISAANFGWPFTYILRGYYDGKISAERAMMDHCKTRSVILRPGAIHGTRHTASNVPIPLWPIFKPMEMIFAPIFRLTGGFPKFLQPPVSVDDVASAALQAAMRDVEEDETLMSKYKIDAGYGHAKGGVPNYIDRSRKNDTTPIFDYDGIVHLAKKWRSGNSKK